MTRKTLGEMRDEQVAAAYDAGRADERTDVVAKLKALAAGLGANLFETHAKNTLGLVARQIERGEHVKGRG